MNTQKKDTHSELLTQEQTEVIQELVNCALACEACSSACLREENIGHLSHCIEITRDCAETCFQAAKFVMRRSPLSEQYLTICEEACRLCAEECRRHQHDHCELCAEACDSCSELCNNSVSKRGRQPSQYSAH